MFRFLQSKKGFTLVELMIVVALLGLGFAAVANLFSAAYKSFAKAEERRVKQEQVKLVVEQLQRTYRVGSASNAYFGESLAFLPTEVDDANTYIYTKYETAEESQSGKAGCYLYIIPTGSNPENPVCVNPDIPLMIWFEPCQRYVTQVVGSNSYQVPVNTAGVNVHIAALEDDSDYSEFINTTTGAFYDFPDMDDIYYQLDVAYHFPNMVERNRVINHIAAEGSGAVTSDLDESPNIFLKLAIERINNGDDADAQAGVTSFCFIATASYGQDSGQVGALCEFRDKCLMTNPLGRAFVKAYYKVSPPIAQAISESEPLKAIVRASLNPLLVVSEYALNEEIRAEGIASFAIFMLCGAGASITLIKFDKRMKKQKNK